MVPCGAVGVRMGVKEGPGRGAGALRLCSISEDAAVLPHKFREIGFCGGSGAVAEVPIDWGHLAKPSGQGSRTALAGKSRERSIPRVRRGRMSRPLPLRPPAHLGAFPALGNGYGAKADAMSSAGHRKATRRGIAGQSAISGSVSRGGSGRQDDSEIRRRRCCAPINRAGGRPFRVSRSGSQIEPA